jgi:glycolate oxidase FAD binding subunit
MTAGTATRIQERFRAILGTDDVLTNAAVATYRLGDTEPLVAVLPDDEVEVSSALALARGEGLGVVPWGAGMHQCLGELPTRYDVALDLRRLNRILAYEPGDMTVTVQAGIGLDELQRHVEDHGQVFPLDPPMAGQATLGGVVATNLSGPLRCRYGTARDLVLGVRVAHADGTITKGGSRVVKNATAYDITKLYVGSHGTLAVILEATLRLHPRPAMERGWWLSGAEIEACQEVATRVLGSHLAPHRVEILDGGGAKACACPSVGPALVVSFAGVAEAVQDQGATLARMAEASGMRATEIVNPAEAFRRLRDFPWNANQSSTRECRATWKGSVLSSDCAKAAGALCEAMGPSVRIGTAMTTSHGTLRGEARAATEDVLIDGLGAARRALESLGGFLVLMEAPRSIRAALGVWGPAPVGANRMRQLKDAFDTKHTLNPGRFVGGI